MIRFSCPKCGKHLKAKENYAGKQVKCGRCALSQLVPAHSMSSVSAEDAEEAHGHTNGSQGQVATGGSPTPPPLPTVDKPKRQSRPVTKSFAGSLMQWPLSGLTFGSVVVALAGVGLLVYFLYPGAVDQKLTDLKSPNPNISRPALEWLAEDTPKDSQRAKVTAALEPLLFNGESHKHLEPDQVLRVYLLWANKDNVPAMIRMVQTPTLHGWNNKMTGLVMDTLGKMQDEHAADALAGKLGDPNLHNQAINALQILGPTAEPAVIAYLFDSNPDARLRAGRVLDNYGTKPRIIVDAALDRLQAKDSEVRHSTVVWFVENGPSNDIQKAEAAPLLANQLEDLSPKVCLPALQALKEWATKDCLAQLLAYSRREKDNITGNPLLIDILAQFKDEHAADALAVQLPNPHARAKAVQALTNLGPVASKAVLRYINHHDEDVQKEARSLARKFGVSADRQLDQTLADVADPRIKRAHAALQQLAAMRPDDATRAKVSPALNAALLDHDAGIRAEALDAVKKWGTRANTETLLKLLNDFQAEDLKQDVCVIDLLGSLKDPKAAPALAQGLTHANEWTAVCKAMKEIGTPAEEAVIPFLQNLDRNARFGAVYILAEIGTNKSVAPLEAAFQNYGSFDNNFANETQVAIQKIMARK